MPKVISSLICTQSEGRLIMAFPLHSIIKITILLRVFSYSLWVDIQVGFLQVSWLFFLSCSICQAYVMLCLHVLCFTLFLLQMIFPLSSSFLYWTLSLVFSFMCSVRSCPLVPFQPSRYTSIIWATDWDTGRKVVDTLQGGAYKRNDLCSFQLPVDRNYWNYANRQTQPHRWVSILCQSIFWRTNNR